MYTVQVIFEKYIPQSRSNTWRQMYDEEMVASDRWDLTVNLVIEVYLPFELMIFL